MTLLQTNSMSGMKPGSPKKDNSAVFLNMTNYRCGTSIKNELDREVKFHSSIQKHVFSLETATVNMGESVSAPAAADLFASACI